MSDARGIWRFHTEQLAELAGAHFVINESFVALIANSLTVAGWPSAVLSEHIGGLRRPPPTGRSA